MSASINRWTHRRSSLCAAIAITGLSCCSGYNLRCIQHLYALMVSTDPSWWLYFALRHFILTWYESWALLSITNRRWATLIFSILWGSNQNWCFTTDCVCHYLFKWKVGDLTPSVTLVNATSHIAVLSLNLLLELFYDASWVRTFFSTVVGDWRVGAVVVVLWCLFEEQRRGATWHLVRSPLRRGCRHACHIVPPIISGGRLHNKFRQLIKHIGRRLSWRFSPRHGGCGWMTLVPLMCSCAFRSWYHHFATDGVIESFCFYCATWLEAWCLLVLGLRCVWSKRILTLIEALA